jgi:hypothetical protein
VTGLLIIGFVVGLGLVAMFFRWLVVEGQRHGDEPTDAVSRVLPAAAGRRDVVITNPGLEPVVVGMAVRLHRPGRFDTLRPHLIIRASRWQERRRHDRGATDVLGVVAPGETSSWSLLMSCRSERIVLLIGQPGGRLRVHEHLVGTAHDPELTYVTYGR